MANINKLSHAQAVSKHRDIIDRYDSKYGCSSDAMVKAIITGTHEETMELAQWLFHYRALRRLESLGD